MISLVKNSFKGRKGKSEGKLMSPAGGTVAASVQEPQFSRFSDLNDDIVRLVFSFAATAPMEEKYQGPILECYRPASLTTSLPLVNKAFREMSQYDQFWEAALTRQLARKDTNHLWLGGLRKLLPLEYKLKDEKDMLGDLRRHVGDDFSYKETYKKIFTRHIKFDAPIFIMPSSVRIGEPYGLHLFEPRYRIMMRNLMSECANANEASRGGAIVPRVSADGIIEPPQLIHACLNARMNHGDMACLVQVQYCHTFENGSADVQLLPIAWVRLDKVRVHRSEGHLFYAQATRL